MRVILATQGTLGDHLPMAGLAQGLSRRGLEVRLACNPAMHPLARRAGVQPLAFGAALGEAEASQSPLAWDHWLASPELRRWTDHDRRALLAEVETLLDLLQPGDLLVGTRNLVLLSLVARVRRCRWLEVGLNSGAMVDYACLPVARHSTHPWKQGLEGLELELRQRLLAGADHRSDPLPLLRLHAVPSAFAPLDYPQLSAVCTGFWCWNDPQWQAWTPPPALERLLAAGPPPLGLVFSSQPLVDPAAVLLRHLEVAQRLERPLVLVRGWAFSRQAEARSPQLAAVLQHPSLLAVDPLPLDWLLPRLGAVFLHGGIGTLAQALRAGCPVVIEPYGHDQFLNARLALRQRLALVVHPHHLDPPQVAEALATQLAGRSSRLQPEAFVGLPVALRHVEQALAGGL